MNSKRLTAVVSIEVVEQGLATGWLYRDQPDRDGDSGWRVFSGAESDDFADSPDHFVELSLADLLTLDPGLQTVLDAPVGTCYEREDGSDELIVVRDFDLED